MDNCPISVNFKLTTNSRYVEEMEKSRPLHAEDEELIAQSFKPEYVKPVQVFCLIAPNSKRNKIYRFIRGEISDSTQPKTARIFQPTRRERDLVVRSPRGSIDFNRSIFGEIHSKQVNAHKFESPGIHNDGIFGFTKPYTPRQEPEQPVRLGLFIAKKLMTPLGVSRVQDTLDDPKNYKILTEILKWVEKKGNVYPIDELKNDPVLSPRVEGQEVKAKNLEDHMYSTSHRFYTPHPPARTLRKSARFQTNYTTAYQETYCDEMHQTLCPKVDPPIKPVTNNTPFAQFPESSEDFPEYHSPLLVSQSKTNFLLGKFNNKVFNSQTCL